MLGSSSNGGKGVGVGESSIGKNWGLGSTDSWGEVLGVANLIDAKIKNKKC